LGRGRGKGCRRKVPDSLPRHIALSCASCMSWEYVTRFKSLREPSEDSFGWHLPSYGSVYPGDQVLTLGFGPGVHGGIDVADVPLLEQWPF
jgi:hypothetical protein